MESLEKLLAKKRKAIRKELSKLPQWNDLTERERRDWVTLELDSRQDEEDFFS